MTRARPFRFDDLREHAPAPAEAPRDRAFSADDLAAARAEGIAEGRRLAMETIAADEAAALSRIGDAIAAALESVDRESSRTDIDIVRSFLEEFCAGLAAKREIEIADDLLRRLIEHSEDRRAARLCLNPRSLERLAPRLSAVIEKRGAGDFVALEEDPRLNPGEARLEWRGGEVRRGRAEIAAAVAAVFNPAKDTEPRT